MPQKGNSSEQLTAYLRDHQYLNRTRGTADLLRAALHLATPTSVGVPLQAAQNVLIDDDGQPVIEWRWRGQTQSFQVVDSDGNIGLDAACDAAARFAADAWAAGDEPVELSGKALKAIRSGSYVVVFGSFLYDAPQILVDPLVADPIGVAARWLEDASPNGILQHGEASYLTSGDDTTVTIHPMIGGSGSGTAPTAVGIEDVRAELEGTLGIDEMVAATIGSRLPHSIDVDYVGETEIRGVRYTVIVPATIGTAANIGAPYGVSAPVLDDVYGSTAGSADEYLWDELAEFEAVEPARLEPGWIARHRSGITVILRRED
jgi:hypothetical protein